MSLNPLIILHGWSDSYESFENLARFYAEETDREVEVIKLGDWLSMDDEVTYLDLATAMQRAWKKRDLPNSPQSVDIVIHSTGALVVREWMTRFYEADTNPIQHLLMLAPANFGSPLAHKGRAFYGRIIKGWRTGLQTGTKILKGLELAAAYSWELAETDLFSRAYWYGQHRVMATVLVGDRGYDGVRAAANEDGSDGTVRISTANLNAAKLTVDFTKSTEVPSYRIEQPSKRHLTAFAVLEGDHHGSVTMKRVHTPVNSVARELYRRAVSVAPQEWEVWCAELEEITRAYESNCGAQKKPENHLYQNTVVRVKDDVGNPVSDYFLEFYEHDSDTSRLGRFFHRDVLRSVHKHSDDHNYRSLYIDVSLLFKRIDQLGVDALMINLHAEPRFEEGARVGYAEKETGVRLKVDQVVQLFRPNRTLLVDIIIKREMRDVFKIYELQ